MAWPLIGCSILVLKSSKLLLAKSQKYLAYMNLAKYISRIRRRIVETYNNWIPTMVNYGRLIIWLQGIRLADYFMWLQGIRLTVVFKDVPLYIIPWDNWINRMEGYQVKYPKSILLFVNLLLSWIYLKYLLTILINTQLINQSVYYK